MAKDEDMLETATEQTMELTAQALRFIDIASISAFALSGAIAAARERQTFVTMVFFAIITGVGGGTVRDLLIGAPVFWIGDDLVAPVCLAMALLVWFTPDRIWSPRLLAFSDAAGLAAYAVFGTVKALKYGVPPVTAILMGVVTGCAGGIVRDVVAGRPSIFMRHELYVTAATLSATIAGVGKMMDWPPLVIWIGAILAGFLLRGAAIHWSLALPYYGSKRDASEGR